MHPEIERSFRRTLPRQWPRYATVAAITYAVNAANAHFRPAVLRRMPFRWLSYAYVLFWSDLILTFTALSLAMLVVCYYFQLRDRRIHTSLTEAGLVARGIIAGLLACVGFVIALHLDAGALG
jgi:hypothetical protein